MEYNDLFVESELPQPFDNDELYIYFERMHSGDLNARKELIEHNIRLVINEVNKKFSNTPYEKKELICIGLIGLVKSVDTFDTSKNFKFSGYSATCIRNEILMYMRKDKKHFCSSLEESINNSDEGRDIELKDTLCDETVDFVLDYEKKEVYEVIRQIVFQLPEKYGYIVKMHFGFMDGKPMTQYEIASLLGISQSYVSRIIKKALQIISLELQEQGVIEFNTSFVKTHNH